MIRGSWDDVRCSRVDDLDLWMDILRAVLDRISYGPRCLWYWVMHARYQLVDSFRTQDCFIPTMFRLPARAELEGTAQASKNLVSQCLVCFYSSAVRAQHTDGVGMYGAMVLWCYNKMFQLDLREVSTAGTYAPNWNNNESIGYLRIGPQSAGSLARSCFSTAVLPTTAVVHVLGDRDLNGIVPAAAVLFPDLLVSFRCDG